MDNILIYGKDINTGIISQLQSINNVLLTNNASTSIPIGTITQYAGITEPSNWLICDGRTLNTNIFSSLFDVIGYSYGGSNDFFKLPDLRRRVPVGFSSFGTFDLIGDTGGAETHTLITSEIPSHTHFEFSDNQSGSITSNLTNSNTPAKAAVAFTSTSNYSLNSTGASATVGLTSSTGGGGSHNNLQPYIVINYIIYTGITNIPIYVFTYDNYIVDANYSVDYPIDVPYSGNYIININTSAFRTTFTIVQAITIFINNNHTNKSIGANFNEISSHKTLIPLSFIYPLNKGINNISLAGSLNIDVNDYTSFNVISSDNNGGCSDGYIIAGYYTTAPVAPYTTGFLLTVADDDIYVVNINAAARHTVANSTISIKVYINGVDTTYSVLGYTNEANSSKTLVPLYFKYQFNKNTNYYIYLHITSGSFTSWDYPSINWTPVLNNANCIDGYIKNWNGNDPPSSTSGTAFTINVSGYYVLKVNGSCYINGSTGTMQISIFINGTDTGKSLKAYANEATSRKTLVPLSFKYYLSKGTNYFYLKQVLGTLDTNDYASFSWAYTTQ